MPVALIAFGGDFFRSGGSDDGVRPRRRGRASGSLFVAWSVVLLVVGLRVAVRLPWLGVATAVALAGVGVGVLAALPAIL